MKYKSLLLSVAAGAAVGVGSYFLKKKFAASHGKETQSASQPKKAPGKAPEKAAAKVDPASLREGQYSFISGFQNAATVEVRFRYDGSRLSCAVMEDGFLAESGDSHVAVLSGEDFSAQLEYGSYYTGDDFAKLKAELSGKHRDLSDITYGEHRGVLYQNGDHLCLDFPIPGDRSSYLHVTLVKEKGNDDPLSALPEYPDVKMLLSSLTFSQT